MRSWSCDGAYGGAGASCTADRLAPPCACDTTDSFSETIPKENLCIIGKPSSVIGENTWKWKCGGSTCMGEQECSRECIKAEIQAPSNIYLQKNGTKVKVGVKIYAKKDSINSGECLIALNENSTQKAMYDKNKDEINEVQFDYPNSAHVTIKANCKLQGQCGGTNSPDESNFDISLIKPVISVCAEKTCNAQGRCQSTPKSGVASVDDCKASCSSDADCSSGRMIETQP
jgi:hypothetical protein